MAARRQGGAAGRGRLRGRHGELRRYGLGRRCCEAIDSGKPFLGICLGLQLLFDVSYENGRHEGLGVLPGEVVRFDLPRIQCRTWAGTI